MGLHSSIRLRSRPAVNPLHHLPREAAARPRRAQARRHRTARAQREAEQDALSASGTAADRLRRISAGPIHVSQLFLDVPR